MRAEKTKDPEYNKILETETTLETILEAVLEMNRIKTEEQQENPTGLERNLEIIQVIDQIIDQKIVEMILNRNPTNIVNIVIKMVILGNTFARCKPMSRKEKSLRK